ncbi:hypothetical protein PENSPDRAFT_223958 [Peniophora sp. CONT]|nr:hypothetical protein PENSPDRAFT_223958 [Peniophora sp. CONT]
MAPSNPSRLDTNSHAWRAAKIAKLGTRMGGFRAVYASAIGYYGPASSSTVDQYVGNEDPADIEYLVAITSAFLHLLGARNMVPGSDFAARTWRSLVNDGVVELYLDIVQSQGFLAEDARLVYMILLALDRIVKASKDSSGVADLLLSKMRNVWKSFWDTRHMLRPRSFAEHEPQLAGYEEAMINMLRGYWTLYHDRYKRCPPADTYIPHMALFLWMRGNALLDSTDNAFAALNALLGFSVVDSGVSSGHDGSVGFVQEAIIDEFGLEAFCRRVDFDISQQRHPEDLCAKDYLVWNNLVGVMITPQVLPYLLAHGTLGSLISLRAALASMPGRGEEASFVWSAAYIIFRHAFSEHWRAHIEREDAVSVCHIPGEYLIDIIASGLHDAVSHGYGYPEELFGESLCEDMAIIARFFNDVRKNPKRFKPEARALFEQCRSSAPTQWYAALHAVQVAGYRGFMDQDLCRLITNGWTVFGQALGLRPDKERARLQRLKRVHCAWTLCAHHCTEPDVQLKACQGCGDVRYCSRACQKSDWKGHKGQCGNRLKPGPTGAENGVARV